MPRRTLRVALVLLLVLALPLVLWRLYLARVVKRELASIRAAALPINGEELNRWYPAVPDYQNAALVLTQAFALQRVYPDNRSNLILRFKLPARTQALSASQAELLRGYTVLNAACLHKADQALPLPVSRYPIDYSQLMSTPLPHLTWVKNLAELYQYAACLDMLEDRPTSATSNIVSILALARTLDDEPCLISQLVRLRLLKLAVATLERRAGAGGFDAVESSNLLAAFAATHTTNVAARALIGERAMTLPCFRMTKAEAARLHPARAGEDSAQASPPLPCYGPAILRVLGFYELDYGSYLIGMNHALGLLHHPPPDNLQAGAYLARVGAASARRWRTLSGSLLSAYAGVAARENEATALHRLALTALALENYARDNGHFPPELDHLTPRYLPMLLTDPFNGLRLKYRPLEKGYVVYSVGPDRQDNGGVERKQQSDQEPYDITFIVERFDSLSLQPAATRRLPTAPEPR